MNRENETIKNILDSLYELSNDMENIEYYKELISSTINNLMILEDTYIEMGCIENSKVLKQLCNIRGVVNNAHYELYNALDVLDTIIENEEIDLQEQLS